jgi:hypothetical protein
MKYERGLILAWWAFGGLTASCAGSGSRGEEDAGHPGRSDASGLIDGRTQGRADAHGDAGKAADANAARSASDAEAGRSTSDAEAGGSAEDAKAGQTGLDAEAGGGPPPDAGAPACVPQAIADSGTSYHDLASPENWVSFDVRSVRPAGGIGEFAGATFDGRYIYLVPSNPSNTFDPSAVLPFAVRYDTQAASLTDLTAWQVFDVSQVPGVVAGSTSFRGAAFDGRFVYFAPGSGIALRYDTTASFESALSWASLNAEGHSYAGAIFDGRFITFVPTTTPATVLRFDSAGGFDGGSAWQTYTLPGDFYGGVYDGRYVYLPPSVVGDTGAVTRYDSHAPFDASSSWSTFDQTTLPTCPPNHNGMPPPSCPNSQFKGSRGAAFDGRYVYPVIESGATLTRYDTQAPFESFSAWQVAQIPPSLQAQSASYSGAGFDGRYVYYVPAGVGGTLYRFDTEGCFDSSPTSTSWEAIYLGQVNTLGFASTTAGAVFDGRYLYVISDVISRFDTKTPASMPPGFSGSFF